MNKPEIVICSDAGALARKATEQFVARANKAVAHSGRFTVALSGGSTPKALYSRLASVQFRDRVDWSRTHLFWGDEVACCRITPRAIFAWFTKRC